MNIQKKLGKLWPLIIFLILLGTSYGVVSKAKVLARSGWTDGHQMEKKSFPINSAPKVSENFVYFKFTQFGQGKMISGIWLGEIDSGQGKPVYYSPFGDLIGDFYYHEKEKELFWYYLMKMNVGGYSPIKMDFQNYY